MLIKILSVGLVAVFFIGPRNTCSLSAESCETEYPSERVVAVDPVKVNLRLLKALPERWELELTVENVSNHSVFVMTDPIRADGSKGPYISLIDDHSGEMAFKSYPLPFYFVDPNEAAVSLKKLPAGASHREVFSVSLPLLETIPPYGEKPTRRRIDPKQLQFLRASVGILPDDEGIRDLLARKPFGPFVNGVEELMKGESKGKRLIALQTVYNSPNISLVLPSQ